jgi:hypothetical protein
MAMPLLNIRLGVPQAAKNCTSTRQFASEGSKLGLDQFTGVAGGDNETSLDGGYQGRKGKLPQEKSRSKGRTDVGHKCHVTQAASLPKWESS